MPAGGVQRERVLHQRDAALGRCADRIGDAAEGQTEPLGLALGVEQDIAAFRPGHGQAAHHHRQHHAQTQVRAVVRGEPAQLSDREPGVGAAQRTIEVDRGTDAARRGRRREPADDRGRRRRLHARARRRRLARETERLQACLEVMQPVEAPVPLAFEVEHRAEVMAEPRAKLRAALQRLGVGGQPRRRCGQRCDAVVRSQAARIALRPIDEARHVRRRGAYGGRHGMGLDAEAVAGLQPWQHGGGERAVGIVGLVEIAQHGRAAREASAQAVETAARIAQRRAGEHTAALAAEEGGKTGRHVAAL